MIRWATKHGAESVSRSDQLGTVEVSESADLLYHLLVLWAAKGVTPEEVWRALEAREGTSGIAEKAARGK